MRKAATAPLIGRGSEMGRLDALIEKAAGGTGGLVVLQGEHGIGLTSLLDHAAERARAAGAVVLRGVGTRDGRPFGPLLDALGPDPVHEAASFAGWGPGPMLTERAFAVTTTVAEAIERRCQDAPVLVLLDDLDRADGGTLRVLRTLAGIATTLPLLVLAAEHVASETGPGLLDHVGDVLRVGPLPDDDAVALARRLAGDAQTADLEHRVRAAHGVPRAIEDAVVSEVAGSRASGHGADVLWRLRGMQPSAIRAVRAAAVLGRRARLSQIAALAGSSEETIATALATAVDRGVLDRHGGEVVWRSDRLRERVCDELPSALRAALHDEAASLLAAASAPADAVARHLLDGAGDAGIDASMWLRRAASEVWTSDPQRAVRYLRRAVDLAGPLSPARDELLGHLLDPLLWTNQLQEAEQVARELLARARSPEEHRHASTGLALALQHLGRHAEAARLWDDLGDDAIVHQPDRAAIVLAELGYAALVRGDLADIKRRAATADRHATSLDHAGLRCTANTMAALAAIAEGRSREAVRCAETAVEAGGARWIGTPGASVALALARIDADRFDEVEAAVQHGREFAERTGSATHVPALQWATVGLAFVAGRWDDALGEIEAGLAMADEIGAASGRALVLAARSVILLHRGDLESADQAAAAAEHTVITHGPQLGIDWAIWARGLLHEANGEPDRALAVLGNAWDVLAPLRYLLSYRVFAADVVRVALACGDAQRAAAVTATAEEGARLAGVASAHAVALRCRGLLERAPSVLVAAAETSQDSPRIPDRALTASDAALLLAENGDLEGAGRWADDALSALGALGATRTAGALVAQLRNCGLHRASPATAPRATTGWDALTEAESRVAALVAEGLTNREVAARLFLSRHTVDAHLRHVFAKLGIGSRVELARQVGQRP